MKVKHAFIILSLAAIWWTIALLCFKWSFIPTMSYKTAFFPVVLWFAICIAIMIAVFVVQLIDVLLVVITDYIHKVSLNIRIMYKSWYNRRIMKRISKYCLTHKAEPLPANQWYQHFVCNSMN